MAVDCSPGDGPRRRWAEYLAWFHDRHPGVTEDVLAAAVNDRGDTPYDWLMTALLPMDGLVVDAACGSAPLHRLAGGARWVGIDRSAAELAGARGHGAARLVEASATRLPVRSAAARAVVCSMALMIIEPLDDVLAEAARVVADGGLLAAMVPASAPLTIRDRARYARLFSALGVRGLRYPNDPRLRGCAGLLAQHGFELVRDEPCRFAYPLDHDGAGAMLVRSLYLPGLSASRAGRGARVAARWQRGEIGVPLRRLIARRRLAP